MAHSVREAKPGVGVAAQKIIWIQQSGVGGAGLVKFGRRLSIGRSAKTRHGRADSAVYLMDRWQAMKLWGANVAALVSRDPGKALE